MMNNCSDNCKLNYQADGIKNQELEEVKCFTMCVKKSYGMARSDFN